MAVSKLAREHVKVVLNGDGGDELFAGYRRYGAARLLGSLGWVPKELVRPAVAILDRYPPGRRGPLGLMHRLLRGLGQTPSTRYLAWTVDMLTERDKDAWWVGPEARPTEDWIDTILPEGLSPLDTQLLGDQRTILVSDLLVKMDIATMAASLEGRSPFMDHVLAEFAASLPDNYRVRGRTPKAILRDAYADRVPREVTHGPKRGFEIPLESWLRNELQPILRDTLGQPNARVREWVRGDLLDDLLAERTMRDRNWKYVVYALLVLELWLREAPRP